MRRRVLDEVAAKRRRAPEKLTPLPPAGLNHRNNSRSRGEAGQVSVSAYLTPLERHTLNSSSMGIDILLLQEEKGGDLKSVLASEKARFAPEGLVPEVLELYRAWTKGKHFQRLMSLSRDRSRRSPTDCTPS